MNPKNEQYSRNQVCICIDQIGPSGYTGCFYHAYASEGIPFQTSVELLSRMEDFYDVLGYPQADVQLRSFFTEAQQPDYAVLQAQRAALLANKGIGNPQAHRGKKATFQVFVMYRTNATWQGELCWVEMQQTVHFRSALEFLRLLDDATERIAVSTDIIG